MNYIDKKIFLNPLAMISPGKKKGNHTKKKDLANIFSFKHILPRSFSFLMYIKKKGSEIIANTRFFDFSGLSDSRLFSSGFSSVALLNEEIIIKCIEFAVFILPEHWTWKETKFILIIMQRSSTYHNVNFFHRRQSCKWLEENSFSFLLSLSFEILIFFRWRHIHRVDNFSIFETSWILHCSMRL